jgi:hypothetical protein
MDVSASSKLRTKSSSYKKDYKPQMTNNKGLKTTNFNVNEAIEEGKMRNLSKVDSQQDQALENWSYDLTDLNQLSFSDIVNEKIKIQMMEDLIIEPRDNLLDATVLNMCTSQELIDEDEKVENDLRCKTILLLIEKLEA